MFHAFRQAAASDASSWLKRGLTPTLLALLILSNSAGSVTAALKNYLAVPGGNLHQAESPSLATPVNETLLRACVPGSWRHAHEEDTGEIVVYRPADDAFAPSRGRNGYEFLENGVLRYHGIGPADESRQSTGIWVWVSPDLVEITVSDPQGASTTEILRILSCDAALLRILHVADENR